MIHFLAVMSVTFLLISSAWSKCEKDQISFLRTSSLFEKEVTINIPLSVDGKPSCYKQLSALGIKPVKNNDLDHIEYEISPMSAAFENVPSPDTLQYLFIESDQEKKSTRLLMMSFLCSGENPIGADAVSQYIVKMNEEKKGNQEETNIFIYTGRASENISLSQEKKIKAKIYDRFLELYESRSGENVHEQETSNIYIPHVVAGFSHDMRENINRKLYSYFFSHTGSSVNGCSRKFVASMQDFLIDNVSKHQPFNGIEIKKKQFSSHYILKWTM